MTVIRILPNLKHSVLPRFVPDLRNLADLLKSLLRHPTAEVRLLLRVIADQVGVELFYFLRLRGLQLLEAIGPLPLLLDIERGKQAFQIEIFFLLIFELDAGHSRLDLGTGLHFDDLPLNHRLILVHLQLFYDFLHLIGEILVLHFHLHFEDFFQSVVVVLLFVPYDLLHLLLKLLVV